MSLPVGTSLPSFADDKVTSVAELNGVTVVRGLEVHVAGSFVVLVVVLTTSEAVGVQFEVGSIGSRNGISSWSSKSADGRGERKDYWGECNHFEK